MSHTSASVSYNRIITKNLKLSLSSYFETNNKYCGEPCISLFQLDDDGNVIGSTRLTRDEVFAMKDTCNNILEILSVIPNNADSNVW